MENKIYTILPGGTKKEYDVIVSFVSKTTGKGYIVYTDNENDSDNKLKVFASTFDPQTREYLGVIEAKEEWAQIVKLVDNLTK